MKKVRLVLAVIAGLFAVSSYSQEEVNKAIDLYNEVIQSTGAKDFDAAISKAKEAYSILTALTELPEEGKLAKENIENALPGLYLGKADKLTDEFDFEGALAAIEEAKASDKPEIKEAAQKATAKVYSKQADQYLESEDFDGALEIYDKWLALDPENLPVQLYKGIALQKKGDLNAAITSLEQTAETAKATDNGSVADKANAALGVIYRSLASNAQKTKKWSEVIKNAEKSLEYTPGNQSALKLIDFANLNLGSDALNAKPANKVKAAQYLKKVVTDPKLKEQAAKLLEYCK